MAVSRILGEVLRASPGLVRVRKHLVFGDVLRNRPLRSGYGFLAGRLPTGIVSVNAVPAGRLVRLYHDGGRAILRTTQSANDGSYGFSRLDENRPFMLMALDDGDPPPYQPYTHDFAVPVVPVQQLTRSGAVAHAIVQHIYLVGTRIRVLYASPDAWNVDTVISAVGPGWLEFPCSETLPALATGTILIQRRYGS